MSARYMDENRIKIGSFVFEFLPDGDDPGTGLLRVETDSGYATTDLGIARDEWDEFVSAAI